MERSTGKADQKRSIFGIRSLFPNTQCILLLTVFSVFSGAQESQGQESQGRVVYFAGSGNAPLDQHLIQLLRGELAPATSLIEITDDQLATLDSGPIIPTFCLLPGCRFIGGSIRVRCRVLGQTPWFSLAAEEKNNNGTF